MIFDRAIAEFALKSTGYESETRAIEFILEKDQITGKYQHPMIEIGWSDVCLLCSNRQNDHNNEEEQKDDLPNMNNLTLLKGLSQNWGSGASNSQSNAVSVSEKHLYPLLSKLKLEKTPSQMNKNELFQCEICYETINPKD